jgi:predicted  nucleic acid-binding Zn-ribbon protein
LQLNGCCQKNKELTDTLNSERAEAKRCIQELERRLRELQENLMAKMKECSNARDMQMSLKAEIDTYKNLLDAEESRYSQQPTSSTSAPFL